MARVPCRAEHAIRAAYTHARCVRASPLGLLALLMASLLPSPFHSRPNVEPFRFLGVAFGQTCPFLSTPHWLHIAGTLRALPLDRGPRWLPRRRLPFTRGAYAARRRWRRLLAPAGARSASAAQAAGSAHSPAVIDVDATSKVDCERCRLQRERTSNSAGVSGGADAVAVAAGYRHIRKA